MHKRTLAHQFGPDSHPHHPREHNHEHHPHPHDGGQDGWGIEPPTMSDLRPYFSSDEKTAIAHVSLVNSPNELKVLAALMMNAPLRHRSLSDDTSVSDDAPGIFIETRGRRGGTNLPGIAELSAALQGSEQLAHQAQIALSSCPEEIRTLVAIALGVLGAKALEES